MDGVIDEMRDVFVAPVEQHGRQSPRSRALDHPECLLNLHAFSSAESTDRVEERNPSDWRDRASSAVPAPRASARGAARAGGKPDRPCLVSGADIQAGVIGEAQPCRSIAAEIERERIVGALEVHDGVTVLPGDDNVIL